jgi:thiol-disulfide isomerase/thioredoxin
MNTIHLMSKNHPSPGTVIQGVLYLMLISLAVMVLTACSESREPLKVRIGQTVPPLSVQDLDGQPATLQSRSGKLLMINVWATWCAPCRHEMPSLQRLADTLGHDRLELVGLSVDHDEHVVREYLIEQKIRFPSFLDRQFASVNGVLGVRVFPSTFFVAPDGKLLKVIESWREWDDPAIIEDIRNLLPVAEKQPKNVLE